VRIDILAEIEGVEERENGTETEGLRGAMLGETRMIDHRGGTEIYLMTEEEAVDVEVVEEVTAMTSELAKVGENARRVRLLRPRRKNQPQT
jgi:hypothetical protein